MIGILIVDDHSVFRDGIRSILALESDIQVVGEVVSGDEVLKKVGELKPDCILMDINLPGKNGIEVTSLVKRQYPNCRVLVLTVFEDEEYLMEALRAGADGYLLKDSSSEQVVTAIRMLEQGETVIHPRKAKKLVTYHHQETNTTMLTKQEKEVLVELVKGLSNKEISEVLFISDKSAKIHINNIFTKLNVKSRTQAIICAVQHQLVPFS
ncbi:response regulator transcription factor [Sporosarcina sp. D27]|uniref:response regulator n=1 Tax=Sporosarcina sp. D27 TaxID=1382305 RepID=UPI00046F501E|nr:response regulator transcription factor [Sporosarcina sp. D27]